MVEQNFESIIRKVIFERLNLNVAMGNKPQGKIEFDPNLWVDKYTHTLFYYAVQRVNHKETAEDLVQETFFSAFRSKEKFRGDSSEKTYLYSILKRKIIDHYRQKSSNKEDPTDFESPFVEDDKRNGTWIESQKPKDWGSVDIDSTIQSEEFQKTLGHCIDKLPKNQSNAFILKTFKRYDSEEVCNQIGITSSNLWVLIHRARLNLRKCLEKNWFNG